MLRHSSTPTSNLTAHIKLADSTELVGLSFTVQPTADAILFPEYTTGLHAWFLQQVQELDPELSQLLHDEQDEKAFALSPLEGQIEVSGRRLQFYTHQTYQWLVTAFSKPVVQWLSQWLKVLPETIQLRHINLRIISVQVAYPPTTYSNLFQPSEEKTIALSFISPTSFRRKGHHFPLPLPVNVFHSFLRRWNQFSGNPFEPEPFLDWVDENVIILRHELNSVKVAAGKQGSVTGFTGMVEYGLTARAKEHPGFIQLLFSLAKFAPYCGTGHKTPFGLGQTRLGWLSSFQEKEMPAVQLQVLLAKRIEQLTAQLMEQQKRTGGKRATDICQKRATILARREFGESLSEIAEDLEMPYETVKTYVKVARKLLKSTAS